MPEAPIIATARRTVNPLPPIGMGAPEDDCGPRFRRDSPTGEVRIQPEKEWQLSQATVHCLAADLLEEPATVGPFCGSPMPPAIHFAGGTGFALSLIARACHDQIYSGGFLMKRLLCILVLLIAAVVALGYYLDWFKI
jgi:hypothetical protein